MQAIVWSTVGQGEFPEFPIAAEEIPVKLVCELRRIGKPAMLWFPCQLVRGVCSLSSPDVDE